MVLILGRCSSSVWKKKILVYFGFDLELYVDMLIYLLTAVELRPGDKQTIHIKLQLTL